MRVLTFLDPHTRKRREVPIMALIRCSGYQSVDVAGVFFSWELREVGIVALVTIVSRMVDE